jgi:hypothetical protein
MIMWAVTQNALAIAYRRKEAPARQRVGLPSPSILSPTDGEGSGASGLRSSLG